VASVRTWKHFLAMTVAFTVMATVLAAWVTGGITFWTLVSSFTYTVCIGAFCSAAGNFIWPGLEGRDWMVRWAGRIVSMTMAVGFGTLLALAILTSVGIMRTSNFWGAYAASLEVAAYISVTTGGAVMAYEYWRRKYEYSELERVRALKLATEARLSSLESRIHPHFLFNTLNSISSLIHADPVKADEQLQRLCALLRFSLDASETPLVPFEQELKIVRDYLDIEKTRFGDRLRFVLDVPEAVLALPVPPLSVQTLVENSVKHTIAPNRLGGEVRLRATAGDGKLTIFVADDGPGVTEASLLPGHGLDNLRSRLQVLFENRARLAFEPSTVRMEVPV